MNSLECFGASGFLLFTKLEYVKRILKWRKMVVYLTQLFLEHKYDSGYIIEN